VKQIKFDPKLSEGRLIEKEINHSFLPVNATDLRVSGSNLIVFTDDRNVSCLIEEHTKNSIHTRNTTPEFLSSTISPPMNDTNILFSLLENVKNFLWIVLYIVFTFLLLAMIVRQWKSEEIVGRRMEGQECDARNGRIFQDAIDSLQYAVSSLVQRIDEKFPNSPPVQESRSTNYSPSHSNNNTPRNQNSFQPLNKPDFDEVFENESSLDINPQPFRYTTV